MLNVYNFENLRINPRKIKQIWKINLLKVHCVKSVQIRSFFWSIFSHVWTEYGDLNYSVQMQQNMDQKKLRIWTLFYVVVYYSSAPTSRDSEEWPKIEE